MSINLSNPLKGGQKFDKQLSDGGGYIAASVEGRIVGRDADPHDRNRAGDGARHFAQLLRAWATGDGVAVCMQSARIVNIEIEMQVSARGA